MSIPTVSRYVTALRDRGYNIKALKEARAWRYILGSKPIGRPEALVLTFVEANELPM